MPAAKRTTRMTRDVTTARAIVAEIRAQFEYPNTMIATGRTLCEKLDAHLEQMDARTGRRDPSRRRKT